MKQEPPWKRLDESPLQPGDYFIDVFYIEPGRKREGLWRAIVSRCVLSTSPIAQPGERTATTADNWDIMEWDVWDYLHATYGQENVAGLYPCSGVLAKQAIFDMPKPKKGAASHTWFKALKSRIAELEAENAQLKKQLSAYRVSDKFR